MPQQKNNWPPEEVIQLTELAGKDLTWDQIAEAIGTHSGESCRKKFARLKDEGKIEVEEGPSSYEIFKFLRDHERTLEEICNKFDLAPKTVRSRLLDMDMHEGFLLVERAGRTTVAASTKPVIESPVKQALAELEGQKFTIAFASDLHAGSKHCQPTAHAAFIHRAYGEYGVRHIFNPGDTISAIYGYRGHENDLIPAARPVSRKMAWQAVEAQVELADIYYPRLDGLRYYNLGGNHDFWTIPTTGKDAIRMLCDRRDDMTYLGYDVCGIPLTDKAFMRLWHPSGGVSYARSYKLQKGIEAQAIEALQEAIRLEESPKLSALIAGHLHISVFLPTMPIIGALVGTFEAQSNYLKKKALFPDIGGVVMEFTISDNGRISQIGFDWIAFVEQKDDWKRWPLPEAGELDFEAEKLEAVFTIEPEE